mgnify:FL=1
MSCRNDGLARMLETTGRGGTHVIGLLLLLLLLDDRGGGSGRLGGGGGGSDGERLGVPASDYVSDCGKTRERGTHSR